MALSDLIKHGGLELGKLKEALGKQDRRAVLRLLAIAGAAVLVLFVISLSYGRYVKVRRLALSKKADLARFISLRDEYLKKKAILDEVSGKVLAPGAQSPVATIERISGAIGIRDRIASIKPLEAREAQGYTARDVDVRIERIDLNRLVNFLYQIENARSLLVVREFSMKSRFDDPSLLDVSLRLSQIEKAG